MGKMIEIIEGEKFGFLTVIKEAKRRKVPSGRGIRRVLCVCECGKKLEVALGTLRSRRKNISCGCKFLEKYTIHGMKKHPLYSVWHGIKNRLTQNPKRKSYRLYYGAGVRICDEWRDNFLPFYEWAMANGWKKGMHIDKDKKSPTKPGKLYSPEFCSVLTPRENQNNTIVNINYPFNGEMLTLHEISRRTGLSQPLLHKRINYDKVPIEDAFKVEDRRGFCKRGKLSPDQVIEIYTSSMSIKELALRFGLQYDGVWNIKRKKTWIRLINQYEQQKLNQ